MVCELGEKRSAASVSEAGAQSSGESRTSDKAGTSVEALFGGLVHPARFYRHPVAELKGGIAPCLGKRPLIAWAIAQVAGNIAGTPTGVPHAVAPTTLPFPARARTDRHRGLARRLRAAARSVARG